MFEASRIHGFIASKYTREITCLRLSHGIVCMDTKDVYSITYLRHGGSYLHCLSICLCYKINGIITLCLIDTWREIIIKFYTCMYCFVPARWNKANTKWRYWQYFAHNGVTRFVNGCVAASQAPHNSFFALRDESCVILALRETLGFVCWYEKIVKFYD